MKKLSSGGRIKIGCTLIALGMIGVSSAVIAGSMPEKINLLLVDVGSIDTVSKTEKFLQAQDKVSLKSPPKPSAADNVVDPTLMKAAVYVNWRTGVAEYLQDKEDVRRENARRRQVLEGLRNSITGNSENRSMVVAKDYLAVGLDEYSDFIALIERSDSSLSEIEKSISGEDQKDVAPATMFLSVILGDMKKVSKTVPVGDTKVMKTTYTRPATAKVSDFNGERVFSCEVEAKYEFRQTDAVAVEGNDPSADLIKDAMKQIAAKVADKFVKEFTVTVSVPKKLAEEISAEDVSLYLDRKVKKVKNDDGTFDVEVVEEGTPVTSGEPFKALAIAHTVTAVCDNEEFELSNRGVISLSATKRSGKVTVSKSKKAKKDAE